MPQVSIATAAEMTYLAMRSLGWDEESARVQARESEQASEERSLRDISGRRQQGAPTCEARSDSSRHARPRQRK